MSEETFVKMQAEKTEESVVNAVKALERSVPESEKSFVVDRGYMVTRFLKGVAEEEGLFYLQGPLSFKRRLNGGLLSGKLTIGLPLWESTEDPPQYKGVNKFRGALQAVSFATRLQLNGFSGVGITNAKETLGWENREVVFSIALRDN